MRAQRGKVLLRKCRVPRKINKDARAPRAGLPSELQNHAAGAPLQFSQFFPVISRVCVRGRGKSRGSKRVCRGALVSGNVPGKVQSAYPARTARAALIGRIFVIPASTQLTALFFFFTIGFVLRGRVERSMTRTKTRCPARKRSHREKRTSRKLSIDLRRNSGRRVSRRHAVIGGRAGKHARLQLVPRSPSTRGAERNAPFARYPDIRTCPARV